MPDNWYILNEGRRENVIKNALANLWRLFWDVLLDTKYRRRRRQMGSSLCVISG